MIAQLFESTWFWLVLGIILITAEALMPGAFIMWFGFAALGTFVIDLLLPLSAAGEWIVFAVLSLASVGLGWWWKKRTENNEDSDQPLLNQRGQQLVGRVLNLETSITNGRGRVKVDDAFWTVTGEDMPAQSRVRVVNVSNMELEVEPV